MKKENIFLTLKNLSNTQLNELREIAGLPKILNDSLFVFDKKYQQWYFTDNPGERKEVTFDIIKSLINWVETSKTHPVANSNVHFIIRGFEEKPNCGHFDGELYWNKGEAYAKDVVKYFQYVTPKNFYI